MWDSGMSRQRWVIKLLLHMLAAHVLVTGLSASAQKTAPRRIDATHATSTSIGDLSDHVCAIETWIACYARAEPRLCGLLGVIGMKFNPRGRVDISEYWIVDVLPVTAGHIPPRLRGKKWMVPGQIEIRTMKRWGDAKTIMGYGFQPSVYYLKKVGNAWVLAAWTNDVSVTCSYPEPDHPECKLYFWDRDTPWVHDQTLYRKYR